MLMFLLYIMDNFVNTRKNFLEAQKLSGRQCRHADESISCQSVKSFSLKRLKTVFSSYDQASRRGRKSKAKYFCSSEVDEYADSRLVKRWERGPDGAHPLLFQAIKAKLGRQPPISYTLRQSALNFILNCLSGTNTQRQTHKQHSRRQLLTKGQYSSLFSS